MHTIDFEGLALRVEPIIKKLINDTHLSLYDKDDLYQECLMVLDMCNNTYDENKKTKFTTYFYTSAKNRMYDLIRYDNREKRPDLRSFEDVDILLNDVLDTNIDLEETGFTDMFFKMIEYLEKMPRGDITISIYRDEMTMKEVAEKHGISEQRVQQLNKRNIEKLKKVFK